MKNFAAIKKNFNFHHFSKGREKRYSNPPILKFPGVPGREEIKRRYVRGRRKSPIFDSVVNEYPSQIRVIITSKRNAVIVIIIIVAMYKGDYREEPSCPLILFYHADVRGGCISPR